MRFIFLTLILISTQVFAQKKVKDTISYREYSVLKWADFKAAVPEGTKYSASVSSGISYNWSFSTANGVIDFKYDVEARLYRNFSWSLYTKDKKAVLKHEQLHYDITELYARKFRKELKEYVVGRSVRNDISKMYETIEKERTTMQVIYDKESGHSINKVAQAQWETKVSNLLKEYELYK